MVVPVEELVRLVHVYKAPLIDKSIALKRIEDENERYLVTQQSKYAG